MADFASSGAATHKAGKNMSADIPETAWCEWTSGAQAIVQAAARENYTDAYATMDEHTKYLVADAAHCLMAIEAIKYDMSGYTSRGEAQDMINVLHDSATKSLGKLKDKKIGDSFLK